MVLPHTGEHFLAGGHQPDEIEADEAAEDAEEDGSRHPLHLPWSVEGEMEERVAPHEDVGEAGGGDAGDEDGHERCHGEVDHEHLDGENQARHGRFEDAGDGGSRTTSHEHHHGLPPEPESLPEVASYGGASEDDGRLGSYTATETDGDGGGDDRAPAVVPPQPALFSADGIEDARDAVADVVFDDIADEERSEVDTDDR